MLVEVKPAGVGDEMLAARVSLVLSGPAARSHRPGAGQGDVDRRRWRCRRGSTARSRTTPARPSWRGAIQDGLEARKNGDLDTATAQLGRAVELADRSGNTETAELLAKVVDIEDPVTGTVRLKAKVSDVDTMTLDTRSTKTSRVRKSS